MEGCILLVAPLRKACGNYSTIDRIRSHLEKNGYKCVLKESEELNWASSFDNVIAEHQVQLIIALHAYKSGRYIKDTTLPFVLIFGGTDVNENSKEADKLRIMTDTVVAARKVISFSNELLRQAQDLWPVLKCENRCVVIKQAVTTSPSDFSLRNHLRDSYQAFRDCDDVKIFLFVGGIRPVKNPIYLIKAFEDLHSRRRDIIYVILGPVMDEEYKVQLNYELKHLRGVLYVSELSLCDTHAAIKESFALVNSSESEGMPITPLEAMHLGTPVIARDIPGNRSVIDNGSNGLLYTSPQECIEQVERLIDDVDLRKQLVQNAERYVASHHSVAEEEQAYLNVVSDVVRNSG